MTRKEISRRVFVKGSLFGLVASGLALSGCGDSSQFEFTSFGPEPVVGGRQFQVLQSALLQFAPDGSVFSLDFDDHTVARLDSSGAVLWEVGGLNDGTGLFNFPVALVASRDGRIFVADRGNGEIDVLDSDGNPIAVIGVGQLLSARALAIDLDRGLLYVCDGPAHQVLVFELDGTFVRNLGQFGTDSGSGLNFPSGVAVASNGDVHIVDSGNATVQVHGSDGAFLREYGARGSDLG